MLESTAGPALSAHGGRIRPVACVGSSSMSVDTRVLASTGRSIWRRRNDAEHLIREAIKASPGLSVFGTGFDVDHEGRAGEVFVTLTAANEAAKRAADERLNRSLGFGYSVWAAGWRRLQLGDWMIRVYPERCAG